MKMNRRTILKNLTIGLSSLAIYKTKIFAYDNSLNEKFIKISEFLIGKKVDDELAKKYLNIILLKSKKNKYLIDEIYSEINNNLKIKNKKISTLEKEIILYWYSGVANNHVITYFGAYSWKTLKFTKPEGTCGGAFGFWAKNPVLIDNINQANK